MSQIVRCAKCGKLVAIPAYPGDGAYPIPGECVCVHPVVSAEA